MVELTLANFITVGLLSAVAIAAFQYLMGMLGLNPSIIG